MAQEMVEPAVQGEAVRSACSGEFCGLSTPAEWEAIERLYYLPWRVQARYDLGIPELYDWIPAGTFGRLADAVARVVGAPPDDRIAYRLRFDPSRPYVEALAADVDTPYRRAHCLVLPDGEAWYRTEAEAEAALLDAAIRADRVPLRIKYLRDPKSPPIPHDAGFLDPGFAPDQVPIK